jgi:ferric-dicitrate binding protein FerR (iron transport regulator)
VKKHSSEHYRNFSVNDFVLDDFFCAWVVDGDETAAQFWNEWLKHYPEKQPEIEEASAIVRNVSFSEYALSGDQVAQLWQRIKNYQRPKQDDRAPARTFQPWMAKVAASVMLCAVLIFAYRSFRGTDHIQYATAYGETRVITLPDNSSVTLNSNSILRIPADWQTRSTREVWLQGEAFFSVVHLADHQPFRVHTGDDVAVEVLGTTFDVYYRTEETKVVLNTGKIRLDLENDSPQHILMKPGDMVDYKQKNFSKRNVDPTVYSAWTQKKLVLDHTTLREMVALLHNNYGLTVNVSTDSLLNQTVSGTVPLAGADTLVHRIAQAFQVKVTRQENEYRISE